MGDRTYYLKVKAFLADHSDPVKAKEMEAYMRNQFQFLGISSPERKALLKSFIEENGLPDPEDIHDFVKDCWQDPHRELQMMAMSILDKRKKYINPDYAPLFEFMILTKSWWDTVDWIAAHPVGQLFKKYPETRDIYFQKWFDSENLWLNRTVILFQLFYKEKTDQMLLFDTIDHFKSYQDFFMRKACGWALRQYSKTNPEAVEAFIQSTPGLSALTVKEGLKHINRSRS